MAGELSVLKSIKERRDQLKAEQLIVLQVPRWEDPKIFLRCRPIHHETWSRAMDRIANARGKKDVGEVEINANCDVIADGCVEVFATLNNDPRELSFNKDDPYGEKTGLDDTLAASLGLPTGVATRSIIRALFIEEPDILAVAGRLTVFSGYRELAAVEETAGE